METSGRKRQSYGYKQGLAKVITALIAVLFSQQIEAASGITYTGRILDSESNPITSSNVRFTITIYDSAGKCWLYTEQRQVDMSLSAGTFSLEIGSNDSTLVPSSASFNGSTTGPQNLADVFNNIKSFSGLGTSNGCSGTFTPNPSDLTAGRILAVFFSVNSGPQQALPILKLNPVPAALTVGGYGTGELLKISESVNPALNSNPNSALSQTQYDEFWRLIKNPLAAYLPTSGDVTVVSGNNRLTTLLGQALPAGPATNNQVLVSNGTSWTLQTIGSGSVTSVTANAPLTVTGTAAAPVLNIPAATTTADGYLTSTDWNTFNSKQSSSLASGSIWVGNGSGTAQTRAVSGDATLDNTGALTLASTITAGTAKGTAQKVPQITYDAKGRLTAVTEVTIDDNTKLPLAGGTMTGAIAMGAQNITNTGDITMAANKYFTLSANSTDGTAAGQMWYDAGTIKYYDGSSVKSLGVAGAGIANLNGLTAGTQSFAIGTSGTAPAFNSATSTHTLNIPMASSAGVTAGLISKTDYDRIGDAESLNAKAFDTTAASTMGQILYFDSAADKWKVSAASAPVDGQVLKWNDTTKTWEPAADSGGWTAVDASYTTKGIVQFSTDAVTSGVNVASGVATVVRTTTGESNKILSLDGSGIANMYAAGIKGATSGTVTLQSQATTANYSLTLPNVAPAANQTLQSDASGNLSWVTYLGAVSDTATLSAAKIWVGNASNKAVEVSLSGDATIDNAGALTLASTITAGSNKGSAQTVPQITYDAKGRLTNVTEVTINDNTKLPLAGGTMTGAIAMGAQNITNTGDITMAANKYFGLSANSTDGTVAGQIWYDAGTIKYFDGTSVKSLGVAGAGITNLNGLSAGTQSFAIGTSGNAPAFSSSGSTHTLNIPLASAGAGVTAGLLSNAEYAALNAKQSSSLASANVWVGNASGTAEARALTGDISIDNTGATSLSAIKGKSVDATAGSTMGQVLYFDSAADKWKVSAASAPADGQVLKWNNTNKNWEPAADSGGWSAVDASYAAKGIVQFDTNAATSGVNVASGVATVVRTTTGTSSTILSLDGTGVANMYGAGLKGATSGTVTLQSADTSATYSLKFPSVAPAANQSLQSDASGNLSWVSALGAVSDTATLNSAKIWVGNASNKAVEVSVSGDATIDNAGALTLASTITAGSNKGSAQTVPQITYDAKGRLTNVTEVTIDDNTKLPLAGGTMTGAIAMGGQNITNTGDITMAANKYFTLSANSTNGTAAGQMWYDAGTIKYYDGSSVKSLGVAGAGITNLNGLTAGTQSFAIGTSGTAPAFSSATSTHTLNIPMASAAGVTAGLISKTDYDRLGDAENLNAKAFDTTAASTMGQILYFDSAADKWKVSAASAPADGQVLKWNDTTKTWEPAADTGGWSAVDASYAAKGIVQFNTDAVTSGVNVASGVATVVRTTTGESNKILSLDGSGIANMYGAGLKGATSGTVTLQSADTSATYSLKFPNVAPAANQSLQSDASGNLSWVNALGAVSDTATLNAAKIWVGNASNKAVEVSLSGDATMDNAGALTLASTITAGSNKGSAQTVPQITYDAKGRLTAVSEVTIDDNTKLPLAGGTMTGAIAMGGQNITNTGNITMAANKYLGLSANSTDGTVAGQIWYDAGTIKYFDGSSVKSLGVAGAGITNFNGLTAGTQSFAIGTSGNAPAFNSSGSTHTLNIPLASSGASVTAGLLSNAEYAALNAKQSSSLASANVWVGNASGTAEARALTGDISIDNAGATSLVAIKGKSVDATAGSTMGQVLFFDSAADKWKVSAASAPADGQVLKWNNTNKNWEPAADSGGWSAVDASYAAKGIVQFDTNAATSGVNVASGVATVVRTTTGESNKILSLDGSGIANMYAAGIKGATSGMVSLQATSTTANYSLTLPNVAPAANQSLQSDASGNLSWVNALGAVSDTATLNSAKIWVGNASNKAVEVSVSGDATINNAGVLTLASTITAGSNKGSAQTVPQITYDAKGRLTNVTEVTIDDNTKLPLAGGTMTGAIAMGAQNITNTGDITMAANKYFTLSANSTNGTAAGQMWYDAGTIKYYDGSSVKSLGVAGSGISTLNGLSAGTQSFAIGTSGTAPTFSSNTSTHTLNIPMASTSSVTAGLISKTEYDAFNAKQSSSLTSGSIWVGNASNVATATVPNTLFVMKGGQAGATSLGTTDATALSFLTNNSTRMTIDSSGRVGIGTSSMNKLLEVTSSGNSVTQFTRTDDTDNFYNVTMFSRTRSGATVPGSGFGPNIGFSGEYDSTGTTAAMGYIGTLWEAAQDGTLAGADAAMVFSVALNGTTNEAMRISSAGYVGVNNNNPGYPLSVNGVIESKTGGYRFPDGTTQTTAATNVASSTLNSAKIWVGNASNKPAEVSLSGDISALTNAGVVTVDKTTTAQSSKILSLDGSGVANMLGAGLKGSTSGSITLQAPATTANYSLTLPAAQGSANQVLANNGSGVLSWVTPLTGVSNSASLTSGNVWVGNASNIAEARSLSGDISSVSNTGSVTVDKTTTAQSSKILSLDGSGVANVMGVGVKGTTSGTVTLQSQATTANYSLTFPAAQGSANQVLANNGSGVLSWITPLTAVSGSAGLTSGSIWVGNASNIATATAPNSLLIMKGGQAGATSLGTTDATDLTLLTNNATRVTIDSSGNVGIGAASGGEKLEVTGNIKATGQIYGASSTDTDGTIDFNTGNIFTSTHDCSSTIQLDNMKSGASYTVVITSAGTTKCTFKEGAGGTAFSDASFSPTNTDRTASSHTVYTFVKVGSRVYVSWISGFGTTQ